jgi:N-acetyl-anhydromuramyl-L-alanine amidase AmpD
MSALQRRHRQVLTGVAAVAVLLLVRFVGGPPPRAIEICGERLDLGTRVVTWREPGGYDAYQTRKLFTAEPVPDGKLRYSPLRGGLPESMQQRAAKEGLTLADLQQVVHQFVLHFDVCGTSRQCFKVLQDARCLSVHFLLDVDGTIYQTLDVREKAWHATIANDFSVGVEIAHPGAWPQPLNADMRRWYERDEAGWRMKCPEWMEETGIRTPDFIARPDRPEIVSGEVQGRIWFQFDYTTQQYEALARLCAGLSRVFPRIRLEAPRNADGNVVNHALPEDELRAFDGIVGHFHVQKNKQDPGPAMQWDRLLERARAMRDLVGN